MFFFVVQSAVFILFFLVQTIDFINLLHIFIRFILIFSTHLFFNFFSHCSLICCIILNVTDDSIHFFCYSVGCIYRVCYWCRFYISLISAHVFVNFFTYRKPLSFFPIPYGSKKPFFRNPRISETL